MTPGVACAATPASRPARVVAVAFDGLAPFELSIAVEVFGLRRPELGVPWYELVVCAGDPPPLRAVGGLTIDVAHGVEAIAGAGTVIVPAWPRIGEPVPSAVVDALRAAHADGARLVSICSGAFVLAATGLLDGRRAATHWRYAETLQRLHPAVRVDPDILYTDDGDVLTSAGSAAGIDLALHVVRADHGSAIANQVARRLVVAPHREGGQAQFIERPLPAPDDGRLAAVIEWALGRLDERLTVEDLARRAFMSPRTFTRQFRRATGRSPIAWLIEQRVKASLPLLETTEQPVEWIAARSGFASAASYRRHFARQVGVSPSQYRRSFAARADRRAA